MSKINYSVADGYVLRGDEPIAQYEDGQLTFLEGKEQYRTPVVRYLRENNLAADVAPTRPGDELPTEPGAPVKPEPVEVIEAAPVAPLSVRVLARLTNVYPDAPAMTPEEGEKTPAFARWLIANHPEDARSRSALRKFFL